MNLLVMVIEAARQYINAEDLQVYDGVVRPGVKFAGELFEHHAATPLAGWASLIVLLVVAARMLHHSATRWTSWV